MERTKQAIVAEYGPDYYGDKAVNLAAEASNAEREEWMQSPLTKALLMSLECDIAMHFALWVNGGYAGQGSFDEARGGVNALNAVAELVRRGVSFDPS